jgi:hypothetical protein
VLFFEELNTAPERIVGKAKKTRVLLLEDHGKDDLQKKSCVEV